MSQNSTSNRAMHEYLTALLEEEQPSTLDDLTRAPLERLLAAGPAAETATVGTALPYGEALPQEKPTPAVEELVPEQAPETVVETPPPAPPPVPNAMAEYQSEPFQALFFSVAGLNLAVPLKSLGGIHNWQTPKPLFGRPEWYLGMMPHLEEQLNVVDSARWVMPEKYTEELAAGLNYQYLVMLGASHWGLACEQLINTDTLQPEEIKWRVASGKRPWLAGIVKEKMCALINVEALIALLEQGLDNSIKNSK